MQLIPHQDSPRYIRLNERDNVVIVVNDQGVPAGRHAGRAFLEWATLHADELRTMVRALIDRYTDEWVPEAASGQVQRVGRRFALVAAAGELATTAGGAWTMSAWARGVSGLPGAPGNRP